VDESCDGLCSVNLTENLSRKMRIGEKVHALSPSRSNNYWSEASASQAVSVPFAAPPAGSTWITPDSSLQKVRLPVAFTVTGTAFET